MTHRDDLTLYHFFRSSSSWRVRWALRLKEIDCKFVHVDLAKGEARTQAYLAMNPLGHVPVLAIDGAPIRCLTESVAIIEWLDETVESQRRLVPQDTARRAKTRQLTEIVNSSIHPLQNISVFRMHSNDEKEQQAWCRHWVGRGLSAYEAALPDLAADHALGDRITMADIFLVTICENAVRFGIALDRFPRINRIYLHVRQTDACKWAEPDNFMPEGWQPPAAMAAASGR